MTPEERVSAVAQFGFSERQARFLVTVMRHAGICVPRQYATFAGVANGGQKTNAFFEKLVARGYASACPCIHNRARLYHVHHRPLYRALGEPESRYRRPVAARDVRDRLRILDGILASPEVVWLASADEKAHHLATLWPAAGTEVLPHVTLGNGDSRRVRLFPDRLPIGIDQTGRVVLLYLVTAVVNDEFSGFLQRHADLLRVVSGWTLRLLFFKALGECGAAFGQAVHDELASPLSAAEIAELTSYFGQVREAAIRRTWLPSDARLRRLHEAFDTARYRVLYRRWLSDGDAALEVVSSDVIKAAMERGAGRVECVSIPHSYGHLSPLAGLVRRSPPTVCLDRLPSAGVEKGERRGEQAPARPQPPPLATLTIAEELARDWYRLTGRS